MVFSLRFTTEAKDQLQALELDEDAQNLVKLKRVKKCLAQLAANPRHPGLNSHKFREMTGSRGEEVWESYVENNTPSAWRVFWHYGPDKALITIISITAHP